MHRVVPLLALLAIACGAPEEPTWSEDVRPIVANECATCHFEGGSAPFTLQTYEDVAAVAEIAKDAVVNRRMPPWMPDPDCNTFEDERRLTDDEIARFVDWVDSGTPEGEPADPIVIESVSLIPDITGVAVEPYTPDYTEAPDDYRCFELDMDFAEDSYIAGSQVIPGSAAVHHVLVYALDPSQQDDLVAADAAEPGPGYTCFGGPLPMDSDDGSLLSSSGGFPNQIAAWVPGLEPAVFPEDLGIRIAAGSRIVMQVHYSAAAADPAPDETRLELALHDSPPARLSSTRPFAIPNLDIPAGDDSVSFTSTITNWNDTPVTLQTFTSHMHLLGSRQTVRVIRSDGTNECALDIPDWDFDWQQSYRLPASAPIVLQPGDGLELTCVYDNSAENQPVIDGEKQEPRDVSWGEGTLDEMCLLYLTVIEDYAPPEPPPISACAAAESCRDACDGDDFDCLLTCDDVDVSCLACVVGSGVDCGMTACAIPLAAAEECLTSCIMGSVSLGGNLGACLESGCGDAIASFASCAQPTLDAGTCDEGLAACGFVP